MVVLCNLWGDVDKYVPESGAGSLSDSKAQVGVLQRTGGREGALVCCSRTVTQVWPSCQHFVFNSPEPFIIRPWLQLRTYWVQAPGLAQYILERGSHSESSEYHQTITSVTLPPISSEKCTIWEDVQLMMQMSFLKINLFMESSSFFHWQ